MFSRKENRGGSSPTVATLTSSGHISGARGCGSLRGPWPHTMQTRMHTCRWITPCFCPLAPCPRTSPAITWVELEGMYCMVEGVSWEGSHCSQGSDRIVAGFEAHLLWSVLISFGFLSFCGIKVLLLLRVRLCLCGVKGLMSQRYGYEGQSFRGVFLGPVLRVGWGSQATWGRIWFLLLNSRTEGKCKTQIWAQRPSKSRIRSKVIQKRKGKGRLLSSWANWTSWLWKEWKHLLTPFLTPFLTLC